MLEQPAPARPGEVALATHQERRQPVPGAHRVGAQILAAADQVAQLLLLLAGDPDRRRSPAANNRAKRIASRLSVLMRSPRRRSM
jgi:hypothetical protein